MYKFLFLVGFVGLTAVVAYDFKDSEFNEYLMQDLLDYNQEVDDVFVSARNRRDTATENKDDDKKCKSKKHGMWKCCNDNSNSSAFDKYKEMKKQCFQDIRGPKGEESLDMFSCEKVNKTKEEFLCVTQCVGQKLNIVDKDGNLIEDAVKEHVKNDISSSEWQKAVSDSVTQTCIAEAKEAVKANPPESGKCSCAALKFTHCMWREMVKACPKGLQSDSNKCTKLREKLEKGEKVDFHQFHRYHHHSRSEDSNDD